METLVIISILAFIAAFCFVLYNDMSSKYTILDESFGGFMNKS